MGAFLRAAGPALAAAFSGASTAPAQAGAAQAHEAGAAPAPNPYEPAQRDPGHIGPAAAQEDDPSDVRSPFEKYKDELRAQMDVPHAENPELAKMLGTLYRPNAKIGSGSTASAVRHERDGSKVGGRQHSQKADDSVRALDKWLAKNPGARPGDRAAAQNVMRDMENALGGK
jgi:hypothetical protein